MKFLCFLVAVMAVTIASPESESVEVAKRILPGLLSEGGLIGGIISGGGEDGGLLGDVLGGDNGILGGILGLKADILSGLIKTVVTLVGGLVKTLVGVIGSLTKGLEGKTTEPEIYAEFRKHPVKTLCPVCPSLPNPQHASLCQKYCSEQNWKP